MTELFCADCEAVENWRRYQDRLAAVTAAAEGVFSARLDAWMNGAPTAVIGAKRKRAPRAKLAHQCPWIALVIAYLEWTATPPAVCRNWTSVWSMDRRATSWATIPDALLPRKVAALAHSNARVTAVQMEDNKPVCVTFGTNESKGAVPYARLECKNVSAVWPLYGAAADLLARVRVPAAAYRMLVDNIDDISARSWGNRQPFGLELTSRLALTGIVSLVFDDGVPESDVDRHSMLSPTCSRGFLLGQTPSDVHISTGFPFPCATDYMRVYDRSLELVRVKRPSHAQFRHVAFEIRAGAVPRQSARVEARRDGTAPKLPGNSSKRVKL